MCVCVSLYVVYRKVIRRIVMVLYRIHNDIVIKLFGCSRSPLAEYDSITHTFRELCKLHDHAN